MSAPALRPYQTASVFRLRKAYAAGHRRVVLAAPTGSGKTVIGCNLIEGALRKGTLNGADFKGVLWLVHRTELIDQCSARLRALGIEHGIIMAGRRPRAAAVQIASVQTLARRSFPAASVIFIDEAHHARAASYQRIVDAYPDAPIIGLTATPYRLDGKGLGTIFQEIVTVATPNELIELGFLVDPEIYAAAPPDMGGVHVTGGDYREDEAAAVMCADKLMGNVVDTWQRLAKGQTTVVFAVNIAHSKALVERFRAAGVTAEHIDGGTPPLERAAILGRLRSGETRIVSNCQILTEGWDLPALAVAVIARPTLSLALWLQMCGRIMRPYDGKTARILDHAGNTERLGLPTDDIEFSLADKVKRSDGAAPVKRCPECGLIVPAGKRVCPCGYVFIVKTEVPDEAPGTLKKITGRRASAAEKRAWYDRTDAVRISKGYKPGWTAYRFKTRFGHFPPFEWRREAEPVEPREGFGG